MAAMGRKRKTKPVFYVENRILRSKAMDNITFTAWFVAFVLIPITWVIVSHHLRKANSKRIYWEFDNE